MVVWLNSDSIHKLQICNQKFFPHSCSVSSLLYKVIFVFIQIKCFIHCHSHVIRLYRLSFKLSAWHVSQTMHKVQVQMLTTLHVHNISNTYMYMCELGQLAARIYTSL